MAAGAREDRAADLGRLVHVGEPVGEPDQHVGAQRVAGLGPVHRQDHDVTVTLDGAVLGGHRQEVGHARSSGCIGYARKLERVLSGAVSVSPEVGHGDHGGPARRTGDVPLRAPARLLRSPPARRAGLLARIAIVTRRGSGSAHATRTSSAIERDVKTFSSARGGALLEDQGEGTELDDAQPGPAPAHAAAQPGRPRLHAEGDQADGAAHPRGGEGHRRPPDGHRRTSSTSCRTSRPSSRSS